MLELLAIVTILFLAAAAYWDLKTYEVPDWVSYGLLASATGIRALDSVSASSWQPLIEGTAGLIVFLAASLVMYYSGQWGGGDVKLMWGLGMAIGLPLSAQKPFVDIFSWPLLLVFWLNMLFLGAIWGISWLLAYSMKSRSRIRREFRARLQKYSRIRIALLALFLPVAIASYVMRFNFAAMALLGLYLIIALLFYIVIYVRAVEHTHLYKWKKPKELTEGDWIARKVVVGGKVITGPRELGIEKGTISKLVRLSKQRKIDRVLVKQGIPFTPVFLIAYAALLLFGNWLFYITATSAFVLKP